MALFINARVKPHICLCFFNDGSSTNICNVSGLGNASFMYGSSATDVSPSGPWIFMDVGVVVRVTEGWNMIGCRPTLDTNPCGRTAVELKLRATLTSCRRGIICSCRNGWRGKLGRDWGLGSDSEGGKKHVVRILRKWALIIRNPKSSPNFKIPWAFTYLPT